MFKIDLSAIKKLLQEIREVLTGSGGAAPTLIEANSADILMTLQSLDSAISPANNMKAQLYVNKDGVVVPVELDTTAPHANVPIPVVITDINGSSVVNITAGDLNVNIVHDGTDPSSVRIGDGTTLAGVTTSNELKVSDANNVANPIAKFSIARIDSTADPKYYGFLDKDGNWYIMRETTATNTFEYFYSTSATPFTGVSGWSNRALITYVEFNTAF